jgi:hypothetical protein
LDGFGATSVASVVASLLVLVRCENSGTTKCFSPPIARPIYFTISARFPSLNIANIGNSWKTLKPPDVLYTAFIEMHRLPYSVW